MRSVLRLLVLSSSLCGCVEQNLPLLAEGGGGDQPTSTGGIGGDGAAGAGAAGAGGDGTGAFGGGPECWDPTIASDLDDDTQIVGYQAQCSESELDQLTTCFNDGGAFDCSGFKQDSPACADCVWGFSPSPGILNPIVTDSLAWTFVMQEACEAVVKGKTQCLPVSQQVFCAITTCRYCVSDPDYYACIEFASQTNCAREISAECEEVAVLDSIECAGSTIFARGAKAARVICGAPP